MLAHFYACSLEEAVFSDKEDEEIVEHYRLPQYDRTQAHNEEVQRKQRLQTQNPI
jgi:hypothetical protein